MKEAVALTRAWLQKAIAFANAAPGIRPMAPHFEPLFKDLRKYTPNHQGDGWRVVNLYFDGPENVRVAEFTAALRANEEMDRVGEMIAGHFHSAYRMVRCA